MVPAFGFSVGDFVSAIGLTIKISKALRETGGASAECRMVIQDLQNLQQILELLKDLRPAGGSLSHVDAIKGVALTCHIPLKEFAEKIDRNYGSIVTASSTSDHFLRRGGKKVKWAIFATEEVAKFRCILAAKVASIGLLLGVFNSESFSRIEDQNRESRSYLLAKSREHRDSLEKNLSNLAISAHQNLSSEIRGVRNDLQYEIKRVEAHTESRHDVLIREAGQNGNKLDSLNNRISQVHKDAYSNTKVLLGLCFGTATGTDHMFRALKTESRTIGEEVKSIREKQKHMGFQVVGKFQAVYDQVKMIRFVGTSILHCLLPFSEKVLQYLQANMKANMEIYALLLKVQSGLPKQLENGDEFYFEDVLGRTKSLPYEYFRHWEVFESMLRCEFKGLPGEDKVQCGQYSLLSGISASHQIDGDTWQQRVFPGTQIRMSVIMETLGVTLGSCPRPGCRGEEGHSRDEIYYHCPMCQLDYVAQRQLHPTVDHTDVNRQGLALGTDREAPNALVFQYMIGRDEYSTEEQLSWRDPKQIVRIKKELQELMVFLLIHLPGLSVQEQIQLQQQDCMRQETQRQQQLQQLEQSYSALNHLYMIRKSDGLHLDKANDKN